MRLFRQGASADMQHDLTELTHDTWPEMTSGQTSNLTYRSHETYVSNRLDERITLMLKKCSDFDTSTFILENYFHIKRYFTIVDL